MGEARRFGAVKIYTRTGDAGETGLLGGGRVPKDDPRVVACGQVDELNAVIGFALALEPQDFSRDVLERVQRDLFTVGAELAAPDPAKLARALPGNPIGEPEIQTLERAIDAREADLAPLTNFILPGGTPKAAALHLARTVCRRAERGVVSLAHRGALSPAIVKYLNRLSDLLFVLARTANARAGRPDVKW
jgi:cob(I)alamin adenosyltransferase